MVSKPSPLDRGALQYALFYQCSMPLVAAVQKGVETGLNEQELEQEQEQEQVREPKR